MKSRTPIEIIGSFLVSLILTVLTPTRDWGDARFYLDMTVGIEVPMPWASRILIPNFLGVLYSINGLDPSTLWHVFNIICLALAIFIYHRTFGMDAVTVLILTGLPFFFVFFGEPLLEAPNFLFISIAFYIRKSDHGNKLILYFVLAVLSVLLHHIAAVAVGCIILSDKDEMTYYAIIPIGILVLVTFWLPSYTHIFWIGVIPLTEATIITLNLNLIGYLSINRFDRDVILFTIFTSLSVFVAAETPRMIFYLIFFLAPLTARVWRKIQNKRRPNNEKTKDQEITCTEK